MPKYRLNEVAKEDLIRIYRYGIERFGEIQADKYYFSFFEKFEIISKQPYAYPSIEYIRPGYRKCVCGVDSIYFRIVNGIIEIMTIIGRQDFE